MPAASSFRRAIPDWLLVTLIPLGIFLLAGLAELNERIAAATRAYEALQLDELPAALLALASTLAWISWRNNARAKRELLLRIEAEQALAEKQQELRELARRITDAQEAERRQIAHELHDDLGQTLNAIKIEAVGLRNRLPSTENTGQREAAAIVDLIDQVYASVRRLLGRLRPVALDELGLYAALEHALAAWQNRMPSVRFELQGLAKLPTLAEPQALALYRVCQEAVTNALRHAAPGRIILGFAHDSDTGKLRLEIEDDGGGADPVALQHGLGLLGMRERIEGIGGTIEFATRPGAGFAIRVVIPVTSGVTS